MSQLDEAKFNSLIAGCKKCDRRAFEVSAYLDRQVTVMLAKSNNDGRWIYDPDKFVDGVYRIQCMGCQTPAFDSPDCPRCHRPNGLKDALDGESRLVAPSRCPECKGTEMTLTTYAPASVKAVEDQRAQPAQLAYFGDVGYHVAHIACVTCEWTQSATGCPICGGPAVHLER